MFPRQLEQEVAAGTLDSLAENALRVARTSRLNDPFRGGSSVAIG
jgi:hypothetical protein